jgi:hypothetical protein
MGANAQTTVPTFTAGAVLTAAQMNQSARTGVPVFAGTTERDAAFGGTGEKTLAQGQLCYLESTNVVQYYDGSNWATVGPSTGGGLVFITGATFTGVTSVSLPNSTFSATYTNYKVIWNITSVTGTGTITGRYRTSGTDNTAARHYQMSPGLIPAGSASNGTNNGSTSYSLGNQGDATYPMWSLELDFMRPAVNAAIKNAFGHLVFYDGSSNYIGRAILMTHDNSNTPFVADSFSIISSAASSITGNYRVYGYADS